MLKWYLRRAMAQSPYVLIRKVLSVLGRKVGSVERRKRDSYLSTYLNGTVPFQGDLFSYFVRLPDDSLNPHANQLAPLTGLFLAHRFNLLGSGWVEVKHGMKCRGLEGHCYEMGSPVQPDPEGHWLEGRINRSNLRESQRIWGLVDDAYTPIDWHLDFKSGYRWREDLWSHDIPLSCNKGVDIKIPWELARMQHLPQMAWAYGLAKQSQPGFVAPERYIREFRNQILDFIAANPPRFGVNWRSTMDVGIRVSNLLVAYDLFRAYDAEFDNQFKIELFRSAYQHGQHIVDHLEWNGELRGNHYLSNVVCLLFLAAYLPRSPEIDSWLAFAVQELVKEVEIQFNPDGTNFEASTSYHRLSAEMVVYATALVLGLPEEKKRTLMNYDHHLHKGFPKLKPPPVLVYPCPTTDQPTPFSLRYIERLEKMAEFTIHITKKDGHIPQIGDNDSGRFLKLQPLFRPLKAAEVKARIRNQCADTELRTNDPDWNEDHLDHRHLVAAINGFFNRNDFADFTDSGWVETRLVKYLGRGTGFLSYKRGDEPTTAERAGISVNQQSQSLKLYAYPDFGIYIFRSKDVYLAIRCGSIGQNGHGGHAHNDNLSFELNIKGKDFIVDGGSYLYTPLHEMRNRFRSTGAHSTLVLNGLEQNSWAEGFQGLFSMRNDARARVVGLSTGSLRGEHHGFGPGHYRQFELSDSSLIIEDFLKTDSSNEINFNLGPEVQIILVERNGPEEFLLEIRNRDVDLGILLKGFSGVEACDGFFSPGYGKRVKNSLVKCYRSEPQTRIEIDFELNGHWSRKGSRHAP
jgi:hypothetical protein